VILPLRRPSFCDVKTSAYATRTNRPTEKKKRRKKRRKKCKKIKHYRRKVTMQHEKSKNILKQNKNKMMDRLKRLQ
jgi:hypothetical protein